MISVVIPSYNRRESVLDLLADLARQRGVEFEVIVVDDHSTDGTVAVIEARFPRVLVLRNDANRGPAVTRNRGIRAAVGEVIVGFDSDVRLTDENLLRNVALRFRALPQVSGFAFRLLAPDGKTDDTARWWHPVPVKRYAGRTFFTSYFSGTAYAFRKNAVITAGLFPEDIFMHYEEVELAYRILDAGGSIMYVPELVAFHHEHRVSRRSEIKIFYKPRNQVLLAVACLPWLRAISYVVPRLAYQFGVAATHGHLRAFFRALSSAVDLLPKRLKIRRPLKKETLLRLELLRAGVS